MSALRKLALLACSCAFAHVAAAQAPAPPDTTRPSQPLFQQQDLYILGFYTAATIAMFPADKHLARVIRDSALLTNKNLSRASSAFRFFGGSGPFLIGGGLYVVGRVTGIRRVAELGLHGTEAVVVGIGVSGALKALLGRARPYLSADTNPRSFVLARGLKGSEYQSFPSGHATTAFAVAAAVSSETSIWWPETKWIIGPILFGGATLVGLSRIYDDRHWASDVVMGAAVGTFAGLKTVRFNHTHEGNRIDRWLLGGAGSSHLRVIGDGQSYGLAVNYAW